jgi:hypothetical protein
MAIALALDKRNILIAAVDNVIWKSHVVHHSSIEWFSTLDAYLASLSDEKSDTVPVSTGTSPEVLC